MEHAIEVKDLWKSFGNIQALRGSNFTVNEGEIFGLIGPNGAGKTTALRIISTLLQPTSGVVNVFSIDVVKNPEKVREIISYLPEESGAYQNLSGYEYLQFMAGFYKNGGITPEQMVEEGKKISQLNERLDDRVKTYSKGMNRRLLLARALMMYPKLSILDEPTSGLDVIAGYHVRQTIKDFTTEHGVTVLLSSHNMLEVEFLCHRVALIHEGNVIAQGTPDELKDTYSSDNLETAFMEATKIG